MPRAELQDDWRSRFSGFPVAGCRRARFRYSRSLRVMPTARPRSGSLAVTPGPVRSTSGVEMLARRLEGRPGAITTLIIAGGEGVRCRQATCEKTLGVRARGSPNAASASPASAPAPIILAEAGLLDGRRATTHWQRTRHFLKTYPQVKLEPDQHLRRATAISGPRPGSRPASICRWRWSRKISATRSRRRPPGSSCSITAAAAASRNSPRCWN